MEITGFRHQVGGHFGILLCSGHVAKPLDKREAAFYELMSTEIRNFAPEYCGRIQVHASIDKQGKIEMLCKDRIDCHSSATKSSMESQAMQFRQGDTGIVEADPEESPESKWAVECQKVVIAKMLEDGGSWFILLENLVSAYSRPCVIDLKVGTRQHGDHCSEAKKQRQVLKCRESTSALLGVRLIGMQLYESENESYSFVDKEEGRRMDAITFRGYLQKFIKASGPGRAAKIRQRLQSLRQLLSETNGYRFFSTSILICFDADAADTLCDSEAKVRLIDFAHSTFDGFLQDKPYNGVDDGCLLGIDSILEVMISTEMAATTTHGQAEKPSL